LEKAIPWKEARGDTTGTRSFGQFLKFLSDDRPSGCYVIATSNDITKLPPEWVRSGRFDIIFYVGLPNTKAKTAIYEFYLNKYMVETGGFVVSDMPDWTGGEIETACRLADVLEVPVKEAAENVCPISATMAEDIEALERWAKGRTVPAEDPEDKSKLSRVRALD
jgi:SpoVK/Ycf46/Vps4 family AAA+-type ATPase